MRTQGPRSCSPPGQCRARSSGCPWAPPQEPTARSPRNAGPHSRQITNVLHINRLPDLAPQAAGAMPWPLACKITGICLVPCIALARVDSWTTGGSHGRGPRAVSMLDSWTKCGFHGCDHGPSVGSTAGFIDGDSGADRCGSPAERLLVSGRAPASPGVQCNRSQRPCKVLL